MMCPLDVSTDYDEPGIPGEFDEDNKPYFFPARQQRDADNAEQRDDFICRWEYRGHGDCIKGVRVTGEDSFGRMRIVSTDGRSIDSWLELGNGDSVKTERVEHNVINAIAYIPPLNAVVAASVSFSLPPSMLDDLSSALDTTHGRLPHQPVLHRTDVFGPRRRA